MNKRYISIHKRGGNLEAVVKNCLMEAGILGRINPDTRIALKPNLTYPYFKPGVTTSPEVIRATVKVLRDHSKHISIVETDGGYGAWSAKEAFEGHGMFSLAKEFGIQVVNLCECEKELINFQSGWRRCQVPLPKVLLHDTDVF